MVLRGRALEKFGCRQIDIFSFMLPRALFLAVAMTAIHDEDWQTAARGDWGGASEEDPVISIKLVHDGEAPATRNAPPSWRVRLDTATCAIEKY